MDKKYTLVIVGAPFGVNDFLSALTKRFPYTVCGDPKQEVGRYEAQVLFSEGVDDEKLKSFLELEHPYVEVDARGEAVLHNIKASACCCDESIPI